MNIVIDTSVTLPWYVSETFSDSAQRWQEKILLGEVTAHVPSLHFLEFANVLRSRVRRNELDPRSASDLYAIHLKSPLTVIDPPRDVILSTALHFGVTAYDAAFIALAQDLACPLLTAERATTPWVARLGRQVIAIT